MSTGTNKRDRSGTPEPGPHSADRAMAKWDISSLSVVLAMVAVFFLACQSDQSEKSGNETGSTTTDRSPASTRDVDPDSPLAEFLRIADRITNSTNPYLGTLQVPQIRRALAAPGLTVREECRLHADLSSQLLRLGDFREAIAEIETAIDLARPVPDLEPVIWTILHYRRVLALLRQAGDLNCVLRYNRDTCIFPLGGGGIHVEKTPAQEARNSLLAALEMDPDRLSFLWLINFVSMAIGDYPEGVPERYLIPPSAFESSYDVGRFMDIAPRLGMHTFNLCGGAIAEDFDGDGFLDIVTSTFDPQGPLTYYHSSGDGRFEDYSAASGLDQQLGGLNCVGADYDSDGDTDILVLRGAWLFDDGRIRNSLVRNNGDGTFTDVTWKAGMAEPPMPTQAAAWGDYDSDGDLDLFIGNESRLETLNHDGDYPSQLFRSNGDGTFTDIAREAGVENDRYCKGVTAGDYDNDGDLDIYASNVGKNRLYRNDGNWTFTDVAEELKMTAPDGRSFAPWFFDYDNDGWLDLFVAAFQANIGDIAADYLGRPHSGLPPCLYHNEGNGRFTNIAQEVGIAHPYLPMGANFGDLDNDGYLDMYLTTGDPNYQTITPNVMLRNDAGRRFQNVTTSGGFGHLQKGHGVAFADIDNDGDQDIYHQLGGFFPGDRFHNVLFHNPGHGNRFLVIRLFGTATNRPGYGARIRVMVATPQGSTTYHRAVGSVSSFGGSPTRQEIGLGKATSIERIEIDWPISRTTEVITDVPLDSMIGITEGEPGFELLPFKEIALN